MNRRGAAGGNRGNSAVMRRRDPLVIAGPFGTRLSIPISNLPFIVGSDKDLPAGLSVYPILHGLSVPIAPFRFNLVAGAMASQLAISIAMLKDFNLRLGACFDEYCITGASFEVRFVNTSGSPQGLVYVFLDEKDSATPTASNAQNSPRIDILTSNEALPIRHRIDWKPADYVDLNWTSTSALTSPVYVKGFASNTETLTAGDTVGYLYFTGALSVDVRGWKA